MARSPSPENVTDLIAKPPAEYTPEPRYVSRYRDKIRKAAKRGKSAHKTLGVPNVVLNPPGEFLKKQSSVVPKRPEVHHEHYHRPGYQHKLPDWEPIKATEKDAQLSRSLVDFTKRNIDEARNLQPLKPRKYYVDDRHGTVHALKPSGLYPTYRNRKSYGQVPGKVSPTMRRSEPKQKNRETSPHRENKVKTRNYENRHVKRETNSPRRHEKGDIHKIDDARRHNKKNDTNEVRGAGKHEEKQGPHESKDSKKHDRKLKDEKKSKDQKYEKRIDHDETKDTNYDDDNDETKSEGKYDKEDPEELEDTKMERKSSQSAEVRESVSREKDDDVMSRGSVQQPRCRYVTEEERSELLYGMKKKWDEMMKKFQCLPFLTDTPPKAKRKSSMEKDLLQLEKDIQIIERHPYIYVYSDTED